VNPKIVSCSGTQQPTDYRLDPLGHLTPPFNIKFDGLIKCNPLTTETDTTEPFPPGTSVFIQYKGIPTRTMVLSVPIDSSDTSEAYHYYTFNLITGSNRQIARNVITEDRYTSENSALKYDDTDNGITCDSCQMAHEPSLH
jgi:hypothetical protein